MSAYLVLSPVDAEDDLEPHPDLARAQQVSAADIMRAAGVLGGLPSGSYLCGELRVTLQ